MTRSALLLLVVVVACLPMACTIRTIGSDAGPEDAGSQTVGDQCAALANAFCTQAIGTCGVAVTLADCIASDIPGCCVGSVCSAISRSPARSVEVCQVAILSEPCNSVVNFGRAGVAACLGIPQKP